MVVCVVIRGGCNNIVCTFVFCTGAGGCICKLTFSIEWIACAVGMKNRWEREGADVNRKKVMMKLEGAEGSMDSSQKNEKRDRIWDWT